MGTAKSTLGGLATGRKVKEIGEGDQLRDPSRPYGDHFEVEKDDIAPKIPIWKGGRCQILNSEL